jgi:hypothetical protein
MPILAVPSIIGRKKIDAKEVTAKNPQVTLLSEKWRGFDIPVFRVPEEIPGHQFVTFNAQVPLKPEAIQISIGGEAAREEEISGILRSVLDDLEGQTNWQNTGKPEDPSSTALADRVGAVIGTCLPALVLLIVILWITGWKSRALSSELARVQYRKGMKDLGNGLITLGILWAICGVAILAAESTLVLGSIFGLAAVIVAVLGILARRLHAWVNYVVAVLACLQLAMGFLAMGLKQSGTDSAKPGSELGFFLGFVIMTALLYYSINNIRKRSRARATPLGQ